MRQEQPRTAEEAVQSALEADAAAAFGYLVREANKDLSPRAWQVWYFIVFKYQGTARETLEYARVELKRVKHWAARLSSD